MGLKSVLEMSDDDFASDWTQSGENLFEELKTFYVLRS